MDEREDKPPNRVVLGYPGFVSARCGKISRHGNDCREGRRLLYSQFPRNGGHATPC